MRNEIKFKGTYEQLRKILSRESAAHTFPKRTINSIYFDSLTLEDFQDSEEGTVPREKLRFRWYGKDRFEGIGTGNLETKRTLSNHREKSSISVKGLRQRDILELASDLRGKPLFPIVVVQYQRQYFQNGQRYRFTLDSRIVYSKLSKNFSYLNKKIDYSNILELKIGPATDTSIAVKRYADLHTRFSKYCEAVKSFGT